MTKGNKRTPRTRHHRTVGGFDTVACQYRGKRYIGPAGAKITRKGKEGKLTIKN